MADKRHEVRNRLSVDRFTEDEQKDIFNRFVEGGGEVVDLDKAERLKQLQNARSSGSSRRVATLEEEKRKTAAKLAQMEKEVSIAESMKQNPVQKYFESLAIRISCALNGVMNFGASSFKPKFVSLTLEKYQNALLEARMVLASILHQNEKVREQIKSRVSVDSEGGISFELLYRFDSLYDEAFFRSFDVLRMDTHQVNDLERKYIEMFKPLYALRRYKGVLRAAADRAVMIEKELRNLDSVSAFNNSHKLTSQVDWIFEKFYPRLFLLIDYYYKEACRRKELPFREFLGFEAQDEAGYLTRIWREQEEYEAQKERIRSELKGGPRPGTVAAEESSSPLVTDKTLSRGLSLVNQFVDFPEVLESYRKEKTVRALFSLNDKVFLTYALVDFYDKQYSTLFTSNKVKYNLKFAEGKKLDLKKELTDTYYKLNGMVYERVNEYLKVIKEIRKAERDSYVSLEERAGRINQASIRRSQISRNLRKEARGLFDRFSKWLFMLVTDLEGKCEIIQNPEEKLDFDMKISGDRILKGRTACEGVQDAYAFAYTIHYLLADGDIGGYSIVSEKPIYLRLKSKAEESAAESEIEEVGEE